MERDMRSSGAGRNQTQYKRKKKSRRRRQRRKLILVILVVVLAAVGLIFSFAWNKYEKMGKTLIKEKDVKMNELTPETKEAMKGYESIALFGLDNRSTGNFESGNSDAIIVASINKDTGEIKMASIYRDTYLDIEDNKFRKANAAYANGGPKKAIEMLNKNLDLDITDYVSVDFSALVNAIDLLGGIELDITEEEASWMNGDGSEGSGYISSVAEISGKSSSWVSSGTGVHVDGVQATAYTRIRYTEGWDYKRTERQRVVISKMFEKAKQSDLLTLNKLLDELLPDISTSLSLTELLALAKDAGKYSLGENAGFPFEKDSRDIGNLSSMVVPMDTEGKVNLEWNVVQLHKFLYTNESYTPSQTVKDLSAAIQANTGY